MVESEGCLRVVTEVTVVVAVVVAVVMVVVNSSSNYLLIISFDNFKIFLTYTQINK